MIYLHFESQLRAYPIPSPQGRRIKDEGSFYPGGLVLEDPEKADQIQKSKLQMATDWGSKLVADLGSLTIKDEGNSFVPKN